VIVLAQAADGHLAERSFQVIGTFDAPQAAEDEFVFTGQRPMQTMLGLGDDISEIAIDVSDDAGLSPVIATLKAAAPALDIRPWMELSPLSYTIESISETVVGIWLAIMFVLIAIGIVNTQLMAVFERTREFGLLQALGMRARLVLAQVAVESALLAGTGVLIGAALSMLTVLALGGGVDLGPFAEAAERYGAGRVFYPKIILADYANLTLWLWFLAIIAALWPAYAASRISPVEAMSHA
jgi:ABC-type lipoprotein release transport system permease subunit